MAKVILEDLGPFEEAEVELRPLTVFIGRNTVGKSFLLYLIWALSISTPDFDLWAEEADKKGASRLADAILESVKAGRDPARELRQLVKLLIDTLPRAVESPIVNVVEEVFGLKLKDVIRIGSEKGVVRIEGDLYGLELVIEAGGVRVRELYNRIKMDSLRAEVPRPHTLRISWPEYGIDLEDSVYDHYSLARMIVATTGSIIGKSLGFAFFGGERGSALLVDGKAGIVRTLLKPYTDPEVFRGILRPDVQFVRLYYRLLESEEYGEIDIGILEPLLRELGIEIRVRRERGSYRLYARTWTGQEVPLEYSSSGVREILPVLLALASEREPYAVSIEEPEAHLHPRAQRILARVIARAINRLRKHVFITTHSDYLMYALNNLVMLSRDPGKASVLGYAEDELLKPGDVVIYLVRQDGSRAVLERIEVTPEGFDESAFAAVAEELADERAEALM